MSARRINSDNTLQEQIVAYQAFLDCRDQEIARLKERIKMLEEQLGKKPPADIAEEHAATGGDGN